MTGLLYKDFKAIKGHYYINVLIGITILLILLRVFFCNPEIDVIVALYLSVTSIALLGILSTKVEIGIIAADESKNAQLYLLSLSLDLKQYIASKYWFMLIAHYIVLSITVLWGTVYRIQVTDESMEELVMSITAIFPSIICACLCLVAIELPFFILFGSKKGEMVKTMMLLALMFGMIIFLLFGDLTILDMLDLQKFFLFLEEHMEFLFKMQIFFPIISGVVYYCSYLITCRIFERKEICYES